MGQIERFFNCRLVVVAFVLGTVAPVAVGAEPFYLGTWKIVSAVIAPWWDDPVHEPNPTEMKALVGKTLTITATEIQGPRAVACRGTRYQVKEYPADMLFEGAFGEMHTRDKSADPVKIAATVGFHGSRWKTLETNCAIEINYHFIDPNTAAIGLNDYVYILKKQQ